MKKRVSVFVALILLAAWSGHVPADGEQKMDSEEKAIRSTIEHYFKGVSANDVESMKKAFHPDAVMFYMKDGALQAVTQPQWHQRMRSGRPAPEANYRRILSVDRTGDAASVKAIADFETFQFIDYISLLKIDAEWKIINKIFHRKEKRAD